MTTIHSRLNTSPYVNDLTHGRLYNAQMQRLLEHEEKTKKIAEEYFKNTPPEVIEADREKAQQIRYAKMTDKEKYFYDNVKVLDNVNSVWAFFKAAYVVTCFIPYIYISEMLVYMIWGEEEKKPLPDPSRHTIILE